jgi:hypothetical protein
LWLILAAADLADLADGSVEAPEMAAGLSATELADLMGGWGDIRGDMALGERGEPERLRTEAGRADRDLDGWEGATEAWASRPLPNGPEWDGVMARAAAAIKLGVQLTVSKPRAGRELRETVSEVDSTMGDCFRGRMRDALPQRLALESDGAQRTFWKLPGA